MNSSLLTSALVIAVTVLLTNIGILTFAAASFLIVFLLLRRPIGYSHVYMTHNVRSQELLTERLTCSCRSTWWAKCTIIFLQ